MTPEQIAKARRLVDAATPGPHFQNQDDNRLTKSVRALVPQLLDALEAVERERDNARSQVAILVEVLKWYADPPWFDYGKRARAALKAAGVEQ